MPSPWSRRVTPPPGYSTEEGADIRPYTVKSVMVGVGIAETPVGLLVIVDAKGTEGEWVGVQIDLEDADAIAECVRVIRSGVLADA
jgi:hypothetical protein